MNDTAKNKVTIADVATLAGVSATSVSNVLNGRLSRMRSGTKDRILSAIKQLGYTPNLAARQLKTGHSQLIGLVVPSVANPFYGNLARYVEEVALDSGYQVMLGNSNRDPERELQYAEQLWGAGVSGIIIGTSLTSMTHLEDLINQGMHIITFDRPPQEDDRIVTDSIYIDNLQIMRLLVRHLAALGHKRIGLITGPVQTVSRNARLEGYRISLKESGISFENNLVWEGHAKNYGDVSAVELGRQGAHHLLSMVSPPTAIIAMNDIYAFGVYAGARDLGLRIPGDISLTGIDNLPLTEIVEPPLTTVEQPIEEMATLTVSRLLERLEGLKQASPKHRKISPSLKVRASTARCKR